MSENLIDLDAAPFIPPACSIEPEDQLSNVARGQLIWDPSKAKLHLSEGQKGSKSIKGDKLRQELKDQPVMNANVLDFLRANPHLIPKEWEGKYIFFWGTIYRDGIGYLCVRYLFQRGGRWLWDFDWLDDDWPSDRPAAVSAS